MLIPAFCRSCGNAFPSGIEVEDGVMATTFEGNRSGPCPWCGGQWGDVPNGTFNFINDTVEIIRDGVGADRLRKYAGMIEAGRAAGRSAEAIVDEIEADDPALIQRMREAASGAVNNPIGAGLITSAIWEAAKALLS